MGAGFAWVIAAGGARMAFNYGWGNARARCQMSRHEKAATCEDDGFSECHAPKRKPYGAIFPSPFKFFLFRMQKKLDWRMHLVLCPVHRRASRTRTDTSSTTIPVTPMPLLSDREHTALAHCLAQLKACDGLLVQAALNCRMASISGTADVLSVMAARNRNIVLFAAGGDAVDFEPTTLPAPKQEFSEKDGNEVAIYHSFQQGFGSTPGFHQFNLLAQVGEHPVGCTVSAFTLERHGYTMPDIIR